jgi:hypothetical protein
MLRVIGLSPIAVRTRSATVLSSARSSSAPLLISAILPAARLAMSVAF